MTALSLRIFSGTELQEEPSLLVALVEMINASYAANELEGSVHRFPTVEELWQELGRDGRCAIIQDGDNGGLPVAIAGMKHWSKKGEPPQDDEGESEGAECRNWEIGPVACRNEPRYRKKGLIDRCLAALSDVLLERSQDEPVRLWIKIVEKNTATYWRKKGFVQMGAPWIIPKGQWHRDLEFTIIDLCKTISRDGERPEQAQQ